MGQDTDKRSSRFLLRKLDGKFQSLLVRKKTVEKVLHREITARRFDILERASTPKREEFF
jgi:repressor of nif and glnA expression